MCPEESCGSFRNNVRKQGNLPVIAAPTHAALARHTPTADQPPDAAMIALSKPMERPRNAILFLPLSVLFERKTRLIAERRKVYILSSRIGRSPSLTNCLDRTRNERLRGASIHTAKGLVVNPAGGLHVIVSFWSPARLNSFGALSSLSCQSRYPNMTLKSCPARRRQTQHAK